MFQIAVIIYSAQKKLIAVGRKQENEGTKEKTAHRRDGWYTLFGRGFMGEMDKKIAYFSECIQLINVDGRYVPDVYHIVLHILIIIAFVVTLLYREEKTLVDEV